MYEKSKEIVIPELGRYSTATTMSETTSGSGGGSGGGGGNVFLTTENLAFAMPLILLCTGYVRAADPFLLAGWCVVKVKQRFASS
jgi:hypothetical protein